MLTHFTDLTKGSWRYAKGLRGFLRKTIGLEEAKVMLTEQLQNREGSFLLVLEKGIYGNPRSPYRRLLEHVGYEFEDVQALVRKQGLEATLSKLYDDGVYVTLDEFKGRAPIRRPGLEFPVTASDFNNPLLTTHYQGTTGGSRGGGTRVDIDFDHTAIEAAGTLLHLHVSRMENRPLVMIRPGPPAMVGMRGLFLWARGGHMPVKWFTREKPAWNRQAIQGRVFMAYTLLIGRLSGRRIPRPEYVSDLSPILAYISDLTQNGTPVFVACTPSETVRLCMTAKEMGIDISGTAFRGGGEPFTEGKAAVLESVGATGIVGYAMNEAGNIGLGCGGRSQPDDIHIMTNRLAVMPHTLEPEPGLQVQGLFHTSLLTTAPKLMLNVESGDYAVIEDRDCSCDLGALGFKTHVHTIRSYEKLTSDSVMFMGSMLHEVLEQTLPSRFGGSPLDYQLVEEEEGGITRVSVVVSPRIGAVDEDAVIDTVLGSLGFADWSRRQADLWRQNKTLRVKRREPFATRAGKILPLHVLHPSDSIGALPASTPKP